MARLSYGPDGAAVELQQVRVVNLTMTPELDPSGVDYLYTRVDLEVTFTWQPWATASNVGLAAQRPFDSLGVSLAQLQKVFTYPRQTLRFSVGPDLVWEAPGVDFVGLRLPCDAGNGPLPGPLSVQEVVGDVCALGRWKVTFWVTGCSNILLSNRWTVTADTNFAGMTTRTIEGWATARADAVASGRINGADDFRQWFFCPTPLGFKREKIRVKTNETNTRANYLAVDQQDPNPLGLSGANIQAVKFEGEATAGFRAKQDTWEKRIEGIGTVVWSMLQSVLPTSIASCWVKVYGRQDADKAQLIKLAVGVALDRFPGATCVGAFATQGLGSSEAQARWVKAQLMFLPSFQAIAGQGFNTWNLGSAMNYKSDVGAAPGITLPGGLPPAGGGDQYRNPNMPSGSRVAGDGGSRGNWLGALIAQALNSQCEPPDVPPANAPSAQAKLV